MREREKEGRETHVRVCEREKQYLLHNNSYEHFENLLQGGKINPAEIEIGKRVQRSARLVT